MSDSVISPTQLSPHPLPPRPLSNTSSAVGSSQVTTPSVQPVAVPKTRGGFEMDDDVDQEAAVDQVPEEDDDDDDVYDPSLTLDSNGAVPIGDQPSFDRPSNSPAQENGITTVPAQADDSPANMSTPAFQTSAQPADPQSTSLQALPPRDSASDSLSTLPQSRLAHDVVGILEDRIKDDPRGDIAAWLELIQEYKNRNKDDQVRHTYDRYFDVFPLDAEQWCSLVRWEETNDQKFKMEETFRKALMEIPSVEFWSIYISYVRRRNNMAGPNSAKAFQIIGGAFDFALKQIGMDKDSGTLWQEYINFLKSGPGIVGGSGWQDNQKMDNLREAYKKALCMPTGALHALWTDYQAFETGINKINGRKFFQERSPDYMDSRRNYTMLQNLTKDLNRTTKPTLAPAMGYAGDLEYQQQVSLWKQWIQWEKEDPLSLKDDKPDAFLDRVFFTYKQALMALQFWPEMWYDAADFCFTNARDEEGVKLLEQGFTANPESALLAFRLADRIESATTNDDVNDPGAKIRMAKVREPYDKVLDALYTVDRKTDARMQLEVQRLEASAAASSNGQNNAEDDSTAANALVAAVGQATTDAQVEAVRAATRAHLDMLSRIISHIWVALMRATRRVQGKGPPGEKGGGFRAIVQEARKRGRLTPDFWVEAANIEWQCYRDIAGTRIFNIGVKLYPDDNYLPLEYIKHLINKDDLNNARAVFETTVGRFTATNTPASIAKAKPLFAFFHDFESKFGDLSQIQRLESRMRELFPEDPALQLFSTRYQTAGFDPMSVHPIVSPSQTRPRSFVQPSIEIGEAVNSPIQKVIDQITTINSPKRPLETDEDDEQPRKIARGESPFKGAAGRKIAQAQPIRPPAPASLPPQIAYILSILPKASAYTETRFDPSTIHKLIRDVHLPPPGSIGPPRPPQPPTSTGAPAWPPPPQFGQGPPPPIVPPPQGYIPGSVSQPSFSAAPFRYA